MRNSSLVYNEFVAYIHRIVYLDIVELI